MAVRALRFTLRVSEGIVFIEYWDSAEHFQRYRSWRTETGVLAQLVDLLAEPPVIRIAEDSGV